jgi:HK97 gp10 family phage protein
MPDEFLEQIKRLGSEQDRILESVLEAGAAVVADKVRSNLAGAIGRDTKLPSRSTGQLMGALGVSPVKVNHEGCYDIKIGFSEPRRGGDSNAKIANILEYGRHGQPAKPFMKPARNASKAECIAAMKRKFEEEVDNL